RVPVAQHDEIEALVGWPGHLERDDSAVTSAAAFGGARAFAAAAAGDAVPLAAGTAVTDASVATASRVRVLGAYTTSPMGAKVGCDDSTYPVTFSRPVPQLRSAGHLHPRQLA
ncbi:MAG: hypothetical protein ACRDO2_07590, partial [Nocardioidaceae bacterium]